MKQRTAIDLFVLHLLIGISFSSQHHMPTSLVGRTAYWIVYFPMEILARVDDLFDWLGILGVLVLNSVGFVATLWVIDVIVRSVHRRFGAGSRPPLEPPASTG